MSYYDLLPEDEQVTPKTLAEDNNMDIEAGPRTEADQISSLVQAFVEFQSQTMDDTAKWYGLVAIVQAMNDINPDAEIELDSEEGEIKVTV